MLLVVDLLDRSGASEHLQMDLKQFNALCGTSAILYVVTRKKKRNKSNLASKWLLKA